VALLGIQGAETLSVYFAPVTSRLTAIRKTKRHLIDA
jgi:hypothetical protein